MLLGTDGRTHGNGTELCMGGSGSSKERAFLWGGGGLTAELWGLHMSVTLSMMCCNFRPAHSAQGTGLCDLWCLPQLSCSPPFPSALFHSALFCSTPCYSIPFYSILFHSILSYSLPFCFALFYPVPFYSVLSHPVHLRSVLSLLFRSSPAPKRSGTARVRLTVT